MKVASRGTFATFQFSRTNRDSVDLAATSATASTPASSVFGYDLMGGQTSQADYVGNTVTYSRTASYAYNGFLTYDSSTTKRYESNGTTNLYTASSSYLATSVATGQYLLGAVGKVTTTNSKNYSYQNTSSTTTDYVWYASALQSHIAYKPNVNQGTTNNSYPTGGKRLCRPARACPAQWRSPRGGHAPGREFRFEQHLRLVEPRVEPPPFF